MFYYPSEERLNGLIKERDRLYKERREYEYQGEGDEYGRECECGLPSVRMNGLCVKCDLGYKIEQINEEIDEMREELESGEYDDEDEDE